MNLGLHSITISYQLNFSICTHAGTCTCTLINSRELIRESFKLISKF